MLTFRIRTGVKCQQKYHFLVSLAASLSTRFIRVGKSILEVRDNFYLDIKNMKPNVTIEKQKVYTKTLR